MAALQRQFDMKRIVPGVQPGKDEDVGEWQHGIVTKHNQRGARFSPSIHAPYECVVDNKSQDGSLGRAGRI